MNDSRKTLIYVGVALFLGLVTILARPRQEVLRPLEIVNKPLFEKFNDPLKAGRLEVVKYSEDLGEVHTFEVAKNTSNGLWTIPSHGDYPANAQDQMKEAASALIGLTVLGVASEDQQDHQMYGVLEPNKEKLKAGDKGVGLLVSFKDEKDQSLASLIIGQQVKGNPEQRFVRVPGQDPTYVVKISPDKLSTKFEDWIDKDLLKINNWDVERLTLKDYSVVPTVQSYVVQPRFELTTTFNATDSKWVLDEMFTFKGGNRQPAELLPGEELNKEKLDALKNALSDVKIVDVYKKPKGLGSTLKATGEFAKDPEARRSLEGRGFIVNPQNDELLSANGELHVLMKEGVEYILRFGNVAGEQEGDTDGKLNRFMFVTARVDESKFPMPEQEPLPGEVPDAPSSETPASDKPVEKTDDVPAAPGKPASSEQPASEEQEASPSECGQDEEKKAEEKSQEKEAPAESDKKEEKPAAEAPAKPAESADGKSDKPADNQASEEELKRKKLDAERERIAKENQRKMDEWRENKRKAEEKVIEANARFADWYYVISDDVYQKLHLSRSDIIKEGEKAVEEGTGVDAFRDLQQKGLKK